MQLADSWSIKGAWGSGDSRGQSRRLTATPLNPNADLTRAERGGGQLLTGDCVTAPRVHTELHCDWNEI